MAWLLSLLQWLDDAPVRFWFPAWITFAGAVWSAWTAPVEASVRVGKLSRLLFAGSLLLTLAAFRWPSWFVPTDMNPDEAQMLAGAITLQRFPIYWKYVDGATHGPLCEFPLVLAGVLGAPLNYVTARIVAALFEALSLVGVWGILRCFTSERLARLAVLPALAFWSFASFHDFLNYSSELSGICLLALASWGLAHLFTATTSHRRHRWLIYAAGLALGSVPLAKLQLSPQAAAIALVALVLLWRDEQRPLAERRRLAGSFIAGGLTLPVLAATFILIYGLWSQFKTSYILNNFAYSSSGQPLHEMPSRFFGLAVVGYSFAWFLAGMLAFCLLYARETVRTDPRRKIVLAVSWFILGLAYASVLLPRRESSHYLHLLVIPATLVAGLILGVATTQAGATAGRFRPWAPVIWFGLLTLVPQIYFRAVVPQYYLGHLAENRATRSGAARYLDRQARPDDTLAMWGWEPNLYVETGLAQGTRDGCSAFQIDTSSLQDFYLKRYLEDMRRRQPAWFVDAVGPGGFRYEDRAQFAHERYAAVRELITERYEFVGEFQNSRIYRLKNQP